MSNGKSKELKQADAAIAKDEGGSPPNPNVAKKERKLKKCAHEVVTLTVSIAGLIHSASRELPLKSNAAQRARVLDDALDDLIEQAS